MYVDCLFLFIIAINVILRVLIYFTHVRGGDLFGYILSNLVPRFLSYPSLWSEREKRDPGWVCSRGSETKLILRVGERPRKRDCVLNSRTCD